MSAGKEQAFWLRQVAEQLKARGDQPTVFSTAKTPSGPIHIGFGRELAYCDALSRILDEEGYSSEWVFFVDDFDSLKAFPPNIPRDFAEHEEYLGRPMFMVPCPYDCCGSWAEHFAREMLETFPSFGFNPKVYWTHKVYEQPEMKDLVRKALAEKDKIRSILLEVVAPTLSGEKLEAFRREMENWYPCLVLCESCRRLMTTKVTGYRPEEDLVAYRCEACGHEGEVKISRWPVKLRWRIDWPAKWALFKVSCEPAGKDHCVKGGAYDTGERILSEVFGGKPPLRIPYEWVLLGAKAMKTHRGVAFTFAEWLKVAPPEAYRYMLLREDPKKHISFHPERIPQLLDEFERMEAIFFGLEKPANPVEETTARNVYPLCFPGKPPERLPARLPYRFAVILTQLKPLLGEEKVKGKALQVLEKLSGRKPTDAEVKEAFSRLEMAAYWVENYADERFKIRVTEEVSKVAGRSLSEGQREALLKLAEMLEAKEWDEAELQYEVFELGKRLGIRNKIFDAVYLAFLGKPFGPRLAPFLLSLDRDFAVKRLREAAGNF
ncbi:lysine--tRNA ligase [Candidatus Bathyarchaeota archaeon]|nr:MAG: lysine--tRNA ligase [Candidatus Bathyarchaeota archaeon]